MGRPEPLRAARPGPSAPSSTHIRARTSLLVSAALVGARTAESSGLAVVRFPGGVGWADLFNRQVGVNDGWKPLGSMGKTGKFNKLGAIKKAGVQSAAVSNLALQCVALVVG